MWEDGLYDGLMHDAERCDRTFGHGNNARRHEQECAHTERIFHRLMIEGKVRSAVRWITERERGGLLKATDVTTAKDSHGQNVEMSVLEALRLKHPEPADPGVSQPAFLPYPAPPPMVDLDITGGHTKTVARWLSRWSRPWWKRLVGMAGLAPSVRWPKRTLAGCSRTAGEGYREWISAMGSHQSSAIKPPDRFGQVSWSHVARNCDWAAVTASLCILAHVAQSCCTQAARMLKSRSSTCMWSARRESGTFVASSLNVSSIFKLCSANLLLPLTHNLAKVPPSAVLASSRPSPSPSLFALVDRSAQIA